MSEPSADKILAIKAQFPGRLLRQITLVEGSEETHFLVTSPLAIEYKKYLEEILKAAGDHGKLMDALAIAAKAQIRWPDRDVVNELFEKHPRWPEHFSEPLHDMAGANAEVRSKNL